MEHHRLVIGISYISGACKLLNHTNIGDGGNKNTSDVLDRKVENPLAK